MKIAFLGDSYCADGTDMKKHWPAIAKKRLFHCYSDAALNARNYMNSSVIQLGDAGRPFYYSVERFLPRLLETDIIICCVSQPLRLPNKYNLPITSGLINRWRKMRFFQKNNLLKNMSRPDHDIPKKELRNTMQAADFYEQFLLDTEEMYFSNISRIAYIDNLFKEHKKKCIWFSCFDDSFLLPEQLQQLYNKKYYVPVSGPSANISLFNIEMEMHAQDETYNIDRNELAKKITFEPEPEGLYNHFRVAENEIMANIIVDIIQNDQFDCHAIDMKKYFTHLQLDNYDLLRV